MPIIRLLAVAVLALVLPNEATAQTRIDIPATSTWRGATVTLTGTFYKAPGKSEVPAVILMHGCGGLQASVRRSLRAHARYLISQGFSALILDSFGPRRNSGGTTCQNLRKLAEARSYRLRDALDARKWLMAQPGTDSRNIFLMGQSNGGSVAILAAYRKAFGAIAAYYPWCGVFPSPASPSTPLIVFGASRDDWVPPDMCRSRKQTSRFSYIEYENAAHSFDVNSGITRYLGYRVGYNGAATADSRRRMVIFFRRHIR